MVPVLLVTWSQHDGFALDIATSCLLSILAVPFLTNDGPHNSAE